MFTPYAYKHYQQSPVSLFMHRLNDDVMGMRILTVHVLGLRLFR